MLLKGQADIAVPLERIWAALLDMTEISDCVPGLESARQLDERTFEGTIGAHLGPIAGRFTFRGTIVETSGPSDVTDGRGSGAARGTMTFVLDGVEQTTGSRMVTSTTLTVSDAAPLATRLEYAARVDLNGKLAIVGEMVVRATARVLLKEFLARLSRRLVGVPG